jgi:hypothetical protein
MAAGRRRGKQAEEDLHECTNSKLQIKSRQAVASIKLLASCRFVLSIPWWQLPRSLRLRLMEFIDHGS